MEDEDIFKYIWLAVVAFFGGIIGFIRKTAYKHRERKLTDRLAVLLLEISTSMFIAYITYEISIHFLMSVKLCVAIAGLASFAGTDALVTAEKMMLNILNRWGDKL